MSGPREDLPADDLAAAIAKTGADVRAVVDMAWRKGMRDGLDTAAQLVAGTAQSAGLPQVFVGVLTSLGDALRMAQFQVPDAATMPTPPAGQW